MTFTNMIPCLVVVFVCIVPSASSVLVSLVRGGGDDTVPETLFVDASAVFAAECETICRDEPLGWAALTDVAEAWLCAGGHTEIAYPIDGVDAVVGMSSPMTDDCEHCVASDVVWVDSVCVISCCDIVIAEVECIVCSVEVKVVLGEESE